MPNRARGRPSAGEPTLSTERVLDAALEAFAEKGYDGTSVRELARSLGVSHNLIPQRIGTKADLWRAAVDRGFGQLTAALATALTDDPGDDLARLRAVVVRFVEANAARPALLRIITQEAASSSPRFDHLFTNYIDPVRIFGADLMTRLRANGQLRTDSVALMYFFMTHGAGGPTALPAMAERFGSAIDPGDEAAVRRHAEEAVDVLFDGLVARPPNIDNWHERGHRAGMDLRTKIRTEIEAVGGRHDEPEVYGGPSGDPGLAGGPGSISWEVNGDLASVSAAGMAAIIMEVLHPSVMAGVYEQSSYRTQPLRRAQNTLGYVLRTTFGSTEAATAVIARVHKVHSRINGTRPDGVPYRALDPELIGWVHTCIPWAVMEAFHRYRRPLSIAEKDRYLAEQAPIGRMGGAEWVPESVAELEAYVERMRPLMAMTEQTREFLDFLAGDVEGELRATPRQQLERRLGLAASMTLMPVWARHLTGTYQAKAVQRAYLIPNARLQARLVRWAYPVLPCVELATARALGRPAVAAA